MISKQSCTGIWRNNTNWPDLLSGVLSSVLKLQGWLCWSYNVQWMGQFNVVSTLLTSSFMYISNKINIDLLDQERTFCIALILFLGYCQCFWWKNCQHFFPEILTWFCPNQICSSSSSYKTYPTGQGFSTRKFYKDWWFCSCWNLLKSEQSMQDLYAGSNTGIGVQRVVVAGKVAMTGISN